MRQHKQIELRPPRDDIARIEGVAHELVFTTHLGPGSSSSTVERLSEEELRDLFAILVGHLSRQALRPAHEPGPDCPNAPHTCVICQPMAEASDMAEFKLADRALAAAGKLPASLGPTRKAIRINQFLQCYLDSQTQLAMAEFALTWEPDD